MKGHGRVGAQLHYYTTTQLHMLICKETRVQLDKKHWYEHVPRSVETSQ